MSTTTPEGRVKHAIKKVLDELEIYYHCPVQNGMGKPSLDFVCSVGGRFVAIEAKAAGKCATKTQSKTMADIAKSGGQCFLVAGTAQVFLMVNALRLLKEHTMVMAALESET